MYTGLNIINSTGAPLQRFLENLPSSPAKRKNCLPLLSQVKLAVKFKDALGTLPPKTKVRSTGGKISMKGNSLALKPFRLSFPSLSLKRVGAILALLRISSLNTFLLGDGGTARTGKGLAALEVGIELATAERENAFGRDSKITRGMMQAGTSSVGAATAVVRETARRADDKLLRRRMMKKDEERFQV